MSDGPPPPLNGEQPQPPHGLNPSSPQPSSHDNATRQQRYTFTSIVDSFLQGFRSAAAAAPQQQQLQEHSNLDNAGASGAPPQTLATPRPEERWEVELTEQQQQAGHIQEETRVEDQDQSVAEQPRVRAASPPAQLEQPQQQDEEQQSQEQGQEQTPQATQPQARGEADGAPAPHLFRLPITDNQGRAGLLAFTPTALPPLPTGAAHELPVSGDASAYVPRTPIFVPFGASPLPFPFLFDAPTNTAWPILPMAVAMSQYAELAEAAAAADAHGSRFISGPPFRIQLDLHFTGGAPPTPPESRPDPEAAAAFVAELETADAELRRRMARLELGDIGAGVGCAICLETYQEEDRPDWLDGAETTLAQRCVVVPCPGHHTLHLSCLRDWLASSPSDQWACPFCRAPILAPKEERKPSFPLERNHLQQQQTLTLIPARVRGLREEVRTRERQRQWRCDSPACLARYPDEQETDAEEASSTSTGAVAGRTTKLIKLRPCGHEHHLDCLCTSVKLEQSIDATEDIFFASDEDEEQASTSGRASPALNALGRWVVCPTCRIDAWAQLLKRSSSYSKRVREAAERLRSSIERVKSLRREKAETEPQAEKGEI